MLYFWLAIAVFLIVTVFVAIKGERLPRFNLGVLALIFLSLAAVRFYLASFINGYRVDFAWFTNWTINLQTIPFKDLYERGFYVNYQPVYLYILWFVGKIAGIARVLPTEIADPWKTLISPYSTSWVVTLKTVPILADIALAYLAYHVASRTSSRKVGAGAALLILICPAIGIDSLFWAQMESFLMILLVASLISLGYAVYTKKTLWWTLSAVFFMLAVLTKPQAIIFAPVFLAAIISHFNWKSISVALGAAILTLLVVCLPFSQGNVFVWIYGLIRDTSMQYAKICMNAYNVYFLAGLNDKKEVAPIWSFVKIAIPTLLTVLTLASWEWSFKKNSQPSRAKILTVIFWLGFLVMFTVFMFMPEMHERYSYPALICLYFAFAASGRRRILPIIAMLSITLFVNCTWLLSFLKLGGSSWLSVQKIFAIKDIGEMFSFVNLVAWVYGVAISKMILKDGEKA